ncbi:MAG: MerR family transcriptional regulator, partial [bacterium]|nr:MerR family transcriptional regulator [bacterium]
ANGHRSYGQDQLDRLQQVRFFTALGFPLEEIRQIMSDPTFDRVAALRKQRELLAGKLARLRDVLDSIDLAIISNEEGETMDTTDMFGGFESVEQEAAEKWGDTKEYEISQQRTAAYSATDWNEATEEAEGIAARLAELLQGGADPTGVEAVALAEEHRLHIDRRFYPCSKEMHAQLGEMYVADSRFAEYWDKHEPGLAAFMRDAIAANS